MADKYLLSEMAYTSHKTCTFEEDAWRNSSHKFHQICVRQNLLHIWYICQLQLGWHPVAVVQQTFTRKQYIEEHNNFSTITYNGCFNKPVKKWHSLLACGCFGNLYTCVYCVLCCLYCVFVLFRVCILILICFVCTSVRTTATEWQLICS